MSLFKKIFKDDKKAPKEPIDKKIVVENLVNAAEICRKLNIPCWLTDGTLLGYFRENQILSHDEDADLGCFIEDFSPKMTEVFLENGWQIKHVFGRIDLGLELSFIRKGVKLDIFFFYKEGDKLWHGAWLQEKKKRRLIKYYYAPFKLKSVTFYGHSFLIPADTLKYVTTKYGNGWNVPQKNWDWAFGPANAQATDIRIPRNKKKRIR